MIIDWVKQIVLLKRIWRVCLAVRRTIRYEWDRCLLVKELRREDVAPYPAELLTAPGQQTGTICGVLREVYLRSEDEETRRLVRLAVAMAKKMSAKLHYYRDVSAA